MSHPVYPCLMPVDRTQVLRAAAALLTRKATATMDEVARAAGIGRATLHRQFAGRDALVRALEELGLQELEAALDAAAIDEGPEDEAVRRLVSAVEPVAPCSPSSSPRTSSSRATSRTRAGRASTPGSPRSSGADRSTASSGST